MDKGIMRELLLLDLAGFRCGVWKEDILSHEEQNIHWLTSKDGAVTALAMMGAHPVSLADLAYCLGLAPARRARQCPVLVPADHDLLVSFVVEQEAGEIEVSSSDLFPLPAYLQTSFISSCVALEEELVPLVNIRAVQHQISTTHYAPPVPPLHCFFQQGSLQEETPPSLDALRIFTCKRKSFVASAGYFSPDQAITPGPLTTLPLLPDFVQGISLYRNQILILLDLRRYLQLPPEQGDEEGKWLVSTVEGQCFAFVVDDDQGVLPAEAGTFAPLPVLIRSAWRQQAFLYERKILSVLDVRELLASSPDEIHSQTVSSHLAHLDTGEEGFATAFGQEQVEILEFSLYSMIHALPGAEVEDILPFTHCQRLTGTRGLIIGVTLYKEELLPVLDPARCFGRDSIPTADWQLLLVCNGELRGLVLVEKVLGRRMLTVHEQRVLPFAAPRSSVYGCYPVAGQVGLILNILALTAYFDDEQARELFLFADELLPDETEEQVVEEGSGGEESLLENDFLGWKENEPETLVTSGEPQGAFPDTDELEKGASALLVDDPDSLVQSVVASMLTRKSSESERPGESGWPENEEDAGESDDIFSSVVAAMLSHQENGLDIDAEPVNRDGQEEEKVKDSAFAVLQEDNRSKEHNDSKDQKEQESKELSEPKEPQNPFEAPSVPGLLTGKQEKEKTFSEEGTLVFSEDTVPSSEVPPFEEKSDDEIQEDELPLLILTEEQNTLLQSSLAAAFTQESNKEPAKGKGAEEFAAEPEEQDVVTEEVIPPSEEGQQDQRDQQEEKQEQGIRFHRQSDASKGPDQTGHAVLFEEKDIAEEAESKHGEKKYADDTQQLEKTERTFSEIDTWNLLEDTSSFPELKEFTEHVSKIQQERPSLKMPHADFVQQVKFPPLSSPDPRKIKEQLDRARKKERELLFRSVAHDLAEGSQALQPESKKKYRLRMWLFLLLIIIFLGFQVWYFAFQNQDDPRGKNIKSTTSIAEFPEHITIRSDSSPAIQNAQQPEKRKNKADGNTTEQTVSTVEDQGMIGREVEAGAVDQLKPYHYEKDGENTDQQEAGEPQTSGQGKVVSAKAPDSLAERLVQGQLHDKALPESTGASESLLSAPPDEVMIVVESTEDVLDVADVVNEPDVVPANNVQEGEGLAKEKKKEVTKEKSSEKRAITLLRKIGQGGQNRTASKGAQDVKGSQHSEVTSQRKSEQIKREEEGKKEEKELKKSSDPSDHSSHTVNKGDTLWGISEQYTGSGFNYLDVARKNKITNPDLIYPDQQVTLPDLPAPPVQR